MSDGVWVKVHPDDAGGGELPGIGGWATIESVTGNPTRYTYNDGIDWVAFEWTNAGVQSVTTSGGLVETLIVGGGARGAASTGGGVSECFANLKNGPSQIVVGAGGAGRPPTADWSIFGKPSTLEIEGGFASGGPGIHTNGYGSNTVGGISPPPYRSEITGSEKLYSSRQGEGVPFENGRGVGSSGENNATSGSVTIRVPAANDNTGGAGSIPASVRAAVDEAVDQAKEAVRDRRKRR